MISRSNILFLTLKTFSSTGGIEKVCCVAGKAFNELTKEIGSGTLVYSLHDDTKDASGNRYFDSRIFKGFNNNIKKFIAACLLVNKKKRQIVVLSHINLLVVGYLIKLISPKTKLVLFAHGIEIWAKLSFAKRIMFKKCDLIMAVSTYTKNKMIAVNGLTNANIQIVNNCLDPFLPQPDPGNCRLLSDKYGLQKTDIVLLAVTRYSSKEKYKGYDNVLKAMNILKEEFPNLKYLLVGKYDEMEKNRLDVMLNELSIINRVVFTGFVSDQELADHFKVADIFAMPSEKEGFGIVFIEAIYYGLPVLAGNMDGTTDALLHGKLGVLVDPQSINDIVNNLRKILLNKNGYLPDTELLNMNFTFNSYKNKLRNMLLA